MKIAFFEIEPWEKEVLKKAFPKDKLIFSSGKLTENNVNKYKDGEIISVFICSFISEKMIQKMPKLKFITTRSTGYDHIDIQCCQKWRIAACNVPSYGENTVAEHTFALLLALSRKIIESVERTREEHFNLDGLRGFDLKGKTLGVIGTGRIGQHVVRIAQGFEMKVLAYDVFPNLQLAEQYNFEYVTLNNLLKNSDIITLHVPYNKNTHHLLNKTNFALIKKGAYLLNTSRGGVVDTCALVKALKSGKLAGAGLDVMEEEEELHEDISLLKMETRDLSKLHTLLEDHALLHRPNVLVTPHNAFNTREALMRILQTTIDNIKAFKKGKLVNVVK